MDKLYTVEGKLKNGRPFERHLVDLQEARRWAANLDGAVIRVTNNLS